MSDQPGHSLLLFVHSSIDDAGLSVGAVRVLCHLARRAGRKGEAYPSITAIAKTCRMNRHSVIDAIDELEKSGFVSAVRKPGKNTVYNMLPKLKPEPGVLDQVIDETVRAETSGACLGTGQSTATSAYPGTALVPSQALRECLTKSADQVPEPLELFEGAPTRYSNKILHGSADALTHSLLYEKEEEVTKKAGDPGLRSPSNSEPEENSRFSGTESEAKSEPLQQRSAPRRRPGTSGQRPESEAEVIAYVLSRGHKEEDGRYMWANWRSNGFTNAGRPIHDWKAVIDSRACRGFLPSQQKLAERAANKRSVRNLI